MTTPSAVPLTDEQLKWIAAMRSDVEHAAGDWTVIFDSAYEHNQAVMALSIIDQLTRERDQAMDVLRAVLHDDKLELTDGTLDRIGDVLGTNLSDGVPTGDTNE